jgi:hypothetical protein
MEEHQLSMSATTDSSLRRVHTDMHQLAGSLLDISQRLEDRLDVLAERARGDVEPHTLQQKKSSSPAAGEGWHGVPISGESTRFRSRSAQSVTWSTGSKPVRAGQEAVPEQSLSAVREGKRNSDRFVLGGSGMNLGQRKSKSSSWHDDPDFTASAPAHTHLLEQTLGDKGDSHLVDQEISIQVPIEALSTRQGKLALSETTQEVTALEKKQETREVTTKLLELDSRFEAIDKKLEQIVGAVVVRGPANENDDDEDRKRLKEKLKLAIEADRRSRVRTIVSQGEVWLEYMFGICAPDQRLGKRGSRYDLRRMVLKSLTLRIGCTQLKILFCTRLIHPRSRFLSGTLQCKSCRHSSILL